MKKILFVLMATFAVNTLASAAELSGEFSPANNVQAHLGNIIDRVRQCSVLPYTLKNGVKVYHHLTSHCPEVKIVGKGRAKIKVGGHTFFAQLVETADTDGDFYNVEIRDYISNDAYTFVNARAYGDVLLGVLNGVIKKIPQVYVQNQTYLGQFE